MRGRRGWGAVTDLPEPWIVVVKMIIMTIRKMIVMILMTTFSSPSRKQDVLCAPAAAGLLVNTCVPALEMSGAGKRRTK